MALWVAASGVPVGVGIGPRDASAQTPASAATTMVDFHALFGQASGHHEAIAIAQVQRNQAAERRREVLAKLLPRLSLDASVRARTEPITQNFAGGQSVLRPENTTDFSVTFGQTLYTGGRARNELRVATVGRTLGDLGIQSARESLIRDLAQAWFSVRKARENLTSAQERLTGMRRHLTAAEARVRLGADVRASALRLRSEVARLESDVLGFDDRLASAREDLAFLSGTPVDIALGAPPSLDRVTTQTADAPSRRVDLQSRDAEVEAARYQMRTAIGPFLPLIDMAAVYTRQSQNPSSSFVPDEDAFATVTLTWDLFNGGEHLAARRRLHAQWQEKQLEAAHLRRQIRVEIGQSRRGVGVAHRMVAALADTVRYAEENHRVITETYRAGATPYLDVIDASTALGDARRDLANARFDHALSIIRLAQASGQLEHLVDGIPAPSPAVTAPADPVQ